MTEVDPASAAPLRVLVLATPGTPLTDLSPLLGEGYVIRRLAAGVVSSSADAGPADGFADTLDRLLGDAGRRDLVHSELSAPGRRPLQVCSADPAKVSEAALAMAALRSDVLVLAGCQLADWPSPTLRAAEIALLFGIPLATLVRGPGMEAAAPEHGAGGTGNASGDRDAAQQRRPRHDARHQHLETIEASALCARLQGLAPRPAVTAGAAEAQPAAIYQATCLWLSPDALLPGRRYHVRVLGQSQPARVARLRHRLEPGSTRRVATDALAAGETGVVVLEFEQPAALAPFADSADAGGVVFEDPRSGKVLGIALLEFMLRRSRNRSHHEPAISLEALAQLKDQRPCVLWMTGVSGAGKSTIANQLQQRLHGLRYHTCLLDGDNLRHGLNRDLGFTAADRVENIRRVGEVAKLMVDAGLIVITAFISPFRAEREMVRSLFGEREFVEIYIDTPVPVAEQRDSKGLYRKARSGELKNFTGIDSPYEPPEHPEVRVDTTLATPAKGVQLIMTRLRAAGILPRI